VGKDGKHAVQLYCGGIAGKRVIVQGLACLVGLAVKNVIV
jgi:hypothetical protein